MNWHKNHLTWGILLVKYIMREFDFNILEVNI